MSPIDCVATLSSAAVDIKQIGSFHFTLLKKIASPFGLLSFSPG